MEPNCNLSPLVTHQPSLLGGAENMKLLFDDTMSDISFARKAAARHADAWESLRLLQAQNAAVASHFTNMGTILAGQVGVTEGQQSVSPIRTGAADSQNQQPAGAVYPPIRNVDQASAVAASGVGVAAEAVAAAIAKQVDATITPVLAVLQQIAESLATTNASIANVLAQAQPKSPTA